MRYGDHRAQAYPDQPGVKAPRRDTSRAAADGIAPKARSLRARVFDCLKERADTPEGVAARMGEPLANIRPRVSECSAKGLIEDSGRRGPAAGGKSAIIWRVKGSTDAAS